MRDRQRVGASVRSLKDKSTRERNHKPHNSDGAAETVVKNDDLFKACFEHATIGFGIADLKGRLLAVNPAYCAITGYTEDELLFTHSYKTLTHPEDLAANVELILSLREGQIPAFNVEKRYLKKDGCIVWVRNSVSMIRDYGGQPTHFVILTEDITEHKLTAASLREVQDRNEVILSSVADVHIVLDRDWRFLYVNDAALQAIQRPRGKVLGHTLWELYPDVVGTELERQYRRAMEDRVAVAFDFYYRRLDTWWENRFYPTPEGLAVFATEITERKRAERKYKQIFENAGEGIFQSTPDGYYLTANPALAHIHGFDSPEEMIRSCRDISRTIYVDPARRAEFKRLLELHGKVRGFEHQSFRKDGNKIWISVNARAVRDKAGNIVYYEGTAQDISERKEAEQALRESEERYRDLVENSRELICTHDLNGKILSINTAARELFGYELNEMVNQKNIRDVLVPEIRDRFDDYMKQICQEGATSGIMLIQTRTGERRVLEYYNSLRTEGVDAPIVRGIARDITEARRAQNALRESEERYRELFENSKDAIYVHDMGGRYTSVNRAAEKLSGYTREELIGKHFSSLVTPQYAHHVREQLCRKLEALGETTYEVELITKQGRRVPVEVSSRLIVENGLPIGVQGCVRDISERKKAQEASRTYSRRLIEAQEAERRRISLELHDQVGQILTAVKMNLHALRKTCSSPEILTSIEENLNVIDEAVDQVRDLSVDLRPLLLDDFGLVVAVRWYLDRQAKNSGVAVEFISLSLNEDDRFPADLETACFRIVQEAVTNIIRHARATRISIRLEKTGSDLMLVIGDDGAGFDVKAVRTGANGAATLGLRGMEERAQAVGGTLTIDSAPGLGTQICVSFPLTYEQVRTERARSIDWVRV
jgi:PAS domain S-box-containing protein